MKTIDILFKELSAVKSAVKTDLQELMKALIKRREETEKANDKLAKISYNLPESDLQRPLDAPRFNYFIINWEMGMLSWMEGGICNCETQLGKIGWKQLIEIFKDAGVVFEKDEFSSRTHKKVAQFKEFFKKYINKLPAEGKASLKKLMEVLEGYEFVIDNFNDDRKVHRKKVDSITIHNDIIGEITYYQLIKAGEIAISITNVLYKRMEDGGVPNLAKEEVGNFLIGSRDVTDKFGIIPNRLMDFTSTKDSLPPV